MNFSRPRRRLKRRQAGARIPIANSRDLKCRCVRVLSPCCVTMGTVIVGECAVSAVLGNEDKIPVSDRDTVTEFFLQTPQANRRVIAPGSEVIGIDCDCQLFQVTHAVIFLHYKPGTGTTLVESCRSRSRCRVHRSTQS